MQITDEQIQTAERILINGHNFDDERVAFIKRFTSCDVLAAPGSGKTTALMAKLICMAQSLPLPKHAGLLVLSHTNAAIAEIKESLSTECPILFQHPNFVGTVQEFVDTFLAIPYYHNRYKNAVARIDQNIYEEEFRRLMTRYSRRDPRHWNYFKNRFADQAVHFNLKIHGDERCEPWNYATGKHFEIVPTPPNTWKGNVKNNREYIYNRLCEIKKMLYERGILNYDDCYVFANCYLQKCPSIIDALRNRFPYVFIDETQDLQAHQIEIIDKIFNNDATCLQRIGDINQAIYHTGADLSGCHWIPRNVLTINNSLRLSRSNALIVNPFMLSREEGQVVNGVRNGGNVIPPYILVYGQKTKQYLKKCFTDLIEHYGLKDTEEGKKYGFHIIAWNTQWKDESSRKEEDIRLVDIFPDYRKVASLSSCNNLSEYVLRSELCSTTKKRHRLIEDLICESLRLNGFNHKKEYNGKSIYVPYTQDSIDDYIHSLDPDFVKAYKSRVMSVLVSMAKGNHPESYGLLKELILWFITNINSELQNSLHNFLGDSFLGVVNEEISDTDDVPIQIDSVHNVKGQTHCATLYIETKYQGCYDSMHVFKKVKRAATKKRPEEYFPFPFYGELGDMHKSAYARSTYKMIYVGLSRPTHLLCYAMHEDSFAQYDAELLKRAGWEIVDLRDN